MKKETLQKRLSKSTFTKQSKAYQMVSEWINGGSATLRTCHTSGSGRFITNLDYTADVKWLLLQMNVKFIAGNDAPKGGKTGNFIQIKTKIQ